MEHDGTMGFIGFQFFLFLSQSPHGPGTCSFRPSPLSAIISRVSLVSFVSTLLVLKLRGDCDS